MSCCGGKVHRAHLGAPANRFGARSILPVEHSETSFVVFNDLGQGKTAKTGKTVILNGVFNIEMAKTAKTDLKRATFLDF